MVGFLLQQTLGYRKIWLTLVCFSVLYALYLLVVLNKWELNNSEIAKLQKDVDELHGELASLLEEKQALVLKLREVYGEETTNSLKTAEKALPLKAESDRNGAGKRQIWGCRNIDAIQVTRYIGQGHSKLVQLGRYGDREVAVKSAASVVKDVQDCLAGGNYKKESDCYLLSNYKILKEALFLRDLSHPNIVGLLGLCVRSEEHSPHVFQRGITEVVEYGQPVKIHQLTKLPWAQRIKICVDLAGLLSYLEDSPLGSLGVIDFREEQFVLVSSIIKLADLDDVTTSDPECNNMKCLIDGMDIGIKCSNFVCKGMNRKRNLKRAVEVFLEPLLKTNTPTENKYAVDLIFNQLKDYKKIDVENLSKMLKTITS